ncbi:MAG: AMP-binding protein [bacterium]
MADTEQGLARKLDELEEALGSGAPSPERAAALLDEAEALVQEADFEAVRADETRRHRWERYLDLTRLSPFLKALGSPDARERWAETTFPVLRGIDFGLRGLFLQRVERHPERTFLQEMEGRTPQRWSYEQVWRRAVSLAALFYRAAEGPPRVALFAENRLDGAVSDLACLTHGILVTPLSTHLDHEALTWIFDRLGITVAVADLPERLEMLRDIQEEVETPFTPFLIQPQRRRRMTEVRILEEELARLDPPEVAAILEDRTRPAVDDDATVLFTSGSTGEQKGVVFTDFNMLSKRFARAAALPDVGEEESLVAYLPLYHTFGRYLELQGMLFWGGTYTFTGSTSADRLFGLIADLHPTGLISVPARWAQLHERCLEQMSGERAPEKREERFREVTGGRLRWGLSAAGYQEPAVFNFFHRHGVEMCSGFGMTEATGGVTMTPPGAYEEDTVGLPLPGAHIRLTERGELQVTGPYAARYLDPDEGRTVQEGETRWIATGDLFVERESGYLEIVDRIKDIYKNSRGQTIAPLRVERLFDGVPGIKRTFLVGDGRDYNVLLIVPDPQDPVLTGSGQSEADREYFHRIVAAANQELAPYERVVNFSVLDRDFEKERGELTPKGSYRRKRIEEHFSEVIEPLYERTAEEMEVGPWRVRVPRWFFRNLSILEDDIHPEEDALYNPRSKVRLRVRPVGEGEVQVGDLVYRVEGDVVDLGLFARQPHLWLGNPSLVAFSPCREDWDIPLEGVDRQVRIPWREEEQDPAPAALTDAPRLDTRLASLHRLFVRALFGPAQDALSAIDRLEQELVDASLRVADAIRRRLEALARHPVLEVRCLAYRVLLLDEPVMDYNKVLPTFIASGLPFLSRESIESIAQADLEQSRLEAFRKRLHTYRRQLDWPTDEKTRDLFRDIFALLEDFARYHPGYYGTIRSELISWALHDADPDLARAARDHFGRLGTWFEERIAQRSERFRSPAWTGKLVFQEGLGTGEIETLREVLVGTPFLTESIMLAFDRPGFDLHDVPEGGIWISRILSLKQHQLYRVCVNTTQGQHYDLLIVLRTDLDRTSIQETNYWMIALHGHPYGPPVVPQFGSSRAELGAFSLQYLGELTVWERIREFSGWRDEDSSRPARVDWRTLFVKAMSAFFTGWKNSDGRIIPGTVAPSNVVVPEPDYREGTSILSLAGWRRYDGPVSLVEPLVLNFYRQTVSHYPRTKERLEPGWIFDGAVEALGIPGARRFLTELQGELSYRTIPCDIEEFSDTLDRYLEELGSAYHPPLALRCAVERYHDWQQINPQATDRARGDLVAELHLLYRLDRHPDIARYHLYRHTYFAGSDEAITGTLDQLMDRMFRNPDRRPTQMVELSDLQAAITSPEDRLVFTKLVFPAGEPEHPLEVLSTGEEARKEVVVQTHITDKLGDVYTVRTTTDPAEVGLLYRIFIRSGYPIALAEGARYLLVIDDQEQIVGGLQYRIEEGDVAQVDGLLVTHPLTDRGISGNLLEDFCARMESQGIHVVKTYYHLQQFFLHHGFQVHKRWGGLVRFLGEGEA